MPQTDLAEAAEECWLQIDSLILLRSNLQSLLHLNLRRSCQEECQEVSICILPALGMINVILHSVRNKALHVHLKCYIWL